MPKRALTKLRTFKPNILVCLLLAILLATVCSASPTLANEETDNIILKNLNAPYGITIDVEGNIYIIEHNPGALKLLTAGSNQTETLLQSLSYPYAVAVDYGRGDIYLTEKIDGAVKVLRRDADHPALIASGLGDIYGLVADFKGNLYLTKIGVAEQSGTGSILKIDRDHNVSVILERLDNPAGIALDQNDNIYFTEYGNSGNGSLKVMYKNGTVETLAYDLTTPTGVIVASLGDVYFTEYSIGLIKKYSSNFKDVSIVAGNLTKPWGLALDYMEVAPGEPSPYPRYLYVTTSTPDGTLTRIDVEQSRTVIVGSMNEVRLTIPKISASRTIEIDVAKSGIPISSFAFTVENTVYDIFINITKSDAKPDIFKKKPKGEIYQYITFNMKNLDVDDISDAKIFLRVEKTWIETNEIEASNIEFQMYSQEQWNPFQAVRTDEDSKYVYYRAELPSLYGLAIGKIESNREFTTILSVIVAAVVAGSVISIFLVKRKEVGKPPEKLTKKKKKKKKNRY